MIMDCVSAAASLKKLLVAHDAAVSQVSALGKFIFYTKNLCIAFV